VIAAGVPFRITVGDIFVRSVIIESAFGNKGTINIAFTEANATTLNCFKLLNPLDSKRFDSDMFADLDATFNLNNIWINGDKTNDRIVVSYMDITLDTEFK
jgi:hypothetical protein